MNPAIRAKSAKSRATIALHCLKTIKYLGGSRTFDCCFEMNDGDDVVRELRRRARANPEVHALIVERGYGYWLKPDYITD